MDLTQGVRVLIKSSFAIGTQEEEGAVLIEVVLEHELCGPLRNYVVLWKRVQQLRLHGSHWSIAGTQIVLMQEVVELLTILIAITWLLVTFQGIKDRSL